MSTLNDRISQSAIPPGLMAELHAAVDEISRGVRDADAMDCSAKEMDEGREEIKRRLGEISIAVELVREARDEVT